MYGESSGKEDGTGDFNLRLISLERMEKEMTGLGKLNSDGEED